MSNPLSPLLAAGALLVLGASLSCNAVRPLWMSARNTDMCGRVARPLEGTQWIDPDGKAKVHSKDGKWKMLVFFRPVDELFEGELPRIQEMQQRFEQRLVTIGITDAALDKAHVFVNEKGATFPVLAEAEKDFETYGINLLWGSVSYLIDPYDRIVASGLEESAAILEQKLQAR